MKISKHEKDLLKNGIDLDNPKDVDYLYKWAQHGEKAHNDLKEYNRKTLEKCVNRGNKIIHLLAKVDTLKESHQELKTQLDKSIRLNAQLVEDNIKLKEVREELIEALGGILKSIDSGMDVMKSLDKAHKTLTKSKSL